MRCLLIALTLLVPTTAHAQRVYGGGQTPPITQSPARQAPSHPQAPPPQTVPPPIVFPLPPLMTPPAGGLTSMFPGFLNEAYIPRRTTSSHGRVPVSSSYYGGFMPGYAVAEAPIERARPVPVAQPAGALRLAVTPDTAQVFVDGFYVATIADIDARRELMLEPGPHRIEIRAAEYQTLTFDVRIAPREIVTYRGALELVRPIATPPPAATQPAGPMYVIAKCYMGNVPPRPSRLPSGCDIKHVQVIGQR